MLALAQGEAQAQSPNEAQQRLEATQRQLRDRRAAEQGLASDVHAIQAERERINQSLVEMAEAIQAGEGRLTSIEGRLGALEAQEKFLRGSLAERHGTISHLLAAMQRMGRNPPPVMITRREDALVMVRSAMLLAAVFPQMSTQAKSLAGELSDLARVIGETKSAGEKLRSETQRLAGQRTRIASLLEEKRQSLTERQGALNRIRSEVTEISRTVTDLNELIARTNKVISEQTGQDLRASSMPAAGATLPVVASAELPNDVPSARLQGQAGPPPLKAGLAPAAGLDAANAGGAKGSIPPDAVVLQPSKLRLASLNPGRIEPAIHFAKALGRLPLPAQGKRIIKFGDKAQTSRSNGIVIETRPSAQVTSPADGWIVFAGVFRTYGQILIVNAGDGYHILLAGLSQIDVQLGQFVLAGEPVGVMSGAAREGKRSPTTNAPVLYVEFRKDGRSIDPDPWWSAKGTTK